jgi:hypothetical protein
MKRVRIFVGKKRVEALRAIMKQTGRTQASLIDEAIYLVRKRVKAKNEK